jgi:hypothetical protein
MNPAADVDAILESVANDLYGKHASPHVTRAWSLFSRALEEFPYHGSVLYKGPQQMGPANLLYGKPTGYQATMVGIPYDDLTGWRGPYPEDVFAKQFELVSRGWEKGLGELRNALAAADEEKLQFSAADFRVAQAAGIHFRSVANQAQFVRVRNASLASGTVTPEDQRTLRQLLDSEMDQAKQLWHLARRDSRIGFEASNHYFYVPQDLVEKVINCEQIKQELTGSSELP